MACRLTDVVHTILLDMFFVYSIASDFLSFLFFFNDTATTQIYTLSLHDALPISTRDFSPPDSTLIFLKASSPVNKKHPSIDLNSVSVCFGANACNSRMISLSRCRSEEHTSELQSQSNLVCRLLLEKKNINKLAKL